MAIRPLTAEERERRGLPALQDDITVLEPDITGAQIAGSAVTEIGGNILGEILTQAIGRKIPDAAKRKGCLLYTSPSPRDLSTSRMPSSA